MTAVFLCPKTLFLTISNGILPAMGRRMVELTKQVSIGVAQLHSALL